MCHSDQSHNDISPLLQFHQSFPHQNHMKNLILKNLNPMSNNQQGYPQKFFLDPNSKKSLHCPCPCQIWSVVLNHHNLLQEVGSTPYSDPSSYRAFWSFNYRLLFVIWWDDFFDIGFLLAIWCAGKCLLMWSAHFEIKNIIVSVTFCLPKGGLTIIYLSKLVV